MKPCHYRKHLQNTNCVSFGNSGGHSNTMSFFPQNLGFVFVSGLVFPCFRPIYQCVVVCLKDPSRCPKIYTWWGLKATNLLYQLPQTNNSHQRKTCDLNGLGLFWEGNFDDFLTICILYDSWMCQGLPNNWSLTFQTQKPRWQRHPKSNKTRESRRPEIVHGSEKWFPPIVVSFHLGLVFDWTMIVGERINF